MQRVIDELNTLRLDILEQDWVQGIFYSEFLEFGEFPPEYETVLDNLKIRHTFRNIMKAINAWLNEEYSNEEKSWAALSHQVEHQKLLALLAYFIDYGTKNILTKEHRDNAMLACRVYYKLLSIPGYNAYQIYHSQLFAQSLACLGFPKAMCDQEDKYHNIKELTHEVNSVIKGLRGFVADFQGVIPSLQLSHTDMNFEDILSNLVDITGGAIAKKLDVDKVELMQLSQNIYEIIDALLRELDGEPNAVAIRLLFKCIVPKLVAASMDCRNANNLVKASYVAYSSIILSSYGKAALPGYTILLEHLCYNQDGLERGEVRQARVSLVVGLMSLLPEKSYRSMTKWILKLTTTARVPHRQIAMEILFRLMNNNPEEERPPENEPEIISDQPAASTDQASAEQSTSEKPNARQASSDKLTSNPEHVGESSETSNSEAVYVPLNDNQDQNAKNPQKMSQESVQAKVVEESAQGIEGNVQDNPEIGSQNNLDGLDNLNTDILENLDNIGDILGNVSALENLGVNILDIPEFTSQDNPELINQDNPEVSSQNKPEVTSENNPDVTYENNPEVSSLNNPEITGEDNPKPENNENPAKESRGKQKTAPKQNQSSADLPDAAIEETTQDSQTTQETNELEQEITEEEVEGLLRQRLHTAPYAEILRALYERLDDVSSGVRTRAFNMLTECLDSDRAPMKKAIQELNGEGAVSRLMGWAARGVCDERAVVRRAAANLVHHSIAHRDAPPPSPHDLGILVGLCRDASIIVRSGAIAALGDLAEKRPCDAVFDAFMNGPIHQVSDPETKVQQQVVELVQQLLINRVSKFVEGSCEDPRPWHFLGAVTRHNMRRHLEKACLLLAKSSTCISFRLVDILSTHLGSLSDERDLHTLVLLTGVAKHVEYKEVDFALDYYKKLAAAESRNGRLMALLLELLTTCARWMRLQARTELREWLVDRLRCADTDGNSLAYATLARQLAPHDLTWATELMQFFQREAISSGEVADWVRAADLTLVAPVPPSPAMLRFFLAALTNPQPEWSAETLGTAVAGLGRMCIRSRDTAAAAAQPLAALLQDSSPPLVARINALYVLTDICVRYTCIVEPLLGSVCSCVSKESDPMLRRAASRSLTKLILGGYLRLRTPLYYGYCALLTDDDPEVREPVEYYVSCCLPAETIYLHFVDCIMHYNNDEENKINFDGRQLIYDVMLQRLSLVQIMNLQCRFARDVLEQAADVTDEGDGELPDALNDALMDTMMLLCGPRMKLPKKPQRDADGDEMDDLRERVTANIVSHKMKITVAEDLVPAVLRLHGRLSSRGGPVVTYLVRLANDLLTDYQQEIEELLENEPELVQRVQQFQENYGSEPSFGNARNLVTSSRAYHEPATPRKPPANRNKAVRKRKRN